MTVTNVNAGIESLLIFLVFIALSAISTWLQKRRQAEEDDPDALEMPRRSPPSFGRPRPPAQSQRGPEPPRQILTDWQEELRRLLEGDRYEPPRAGPPPSAELAPPSPLRPASVAAPVPPPLRKSVAEAVATAARPVGEDAATAYHRAQELHAQAAAKLLEVRRQTEQHQRSGRLPSRGSTGYDIRAARALLASPQSARQAIVASMILAPPKALEREQVAH